MRIKIGIVIAAIVAAGIVLGATLLLVPPSGEGRLGLLVHDAPCQDCSHVWVTFQSVQVHASNGSGSGWTTLNVSGATVDLMTLTGPDLAQEIGIMTLRAGHYEQVRLAVSNVTVMLTNGTRLVPSLASAMSADVHGQFTVSSGATTTLSIDIDLATSLHVVMRGMTVSATFTPNIGSVVVM